MEKKDTSSMTPEQLAEYEQKIAAQKKRKVENDKRLKKLHREEAVERNKKAKELYDYLKQHGLYDNLTSELQEFVTKLANPAPVHNTVSVFSQLFGENPQVGQSVTLMEAFQKTMKGKSNLDHFVKKWAANGTVVEYEHNPENLLESRYIIREIGTTSEDAE